MRELIRRIETLIEDYDSPVVEDPKTGLTWEKDFGQRLTWDEAPKRPKMLNSKKVGGFSDWRIPTLEELKNVMNYNVGLSKLIPFDTSELDWSSTEYEEPGYKGEDAAWAVSIYMRQVLVFPKRVKRSVRCVRG